VYVYLRKYYPLLTNTTHVVLILVNKNFGNTVKRPSYTGILTTAVTKSYTRTKKLSFKSALSSKCVSEYGFYVRQTELASSLVKFRRTKNID